MLIRSARLLCSAALVMALSACASVIDTPNQAITVMTPGATGARCVLATQDFRVVAYPPQKIFMRRMQSPLNVTCQAPGNREKTVIIYPNLNDAAVTNVATAGLGAVYDQVSGALYEYPNPIKIDFTNTLATVGSLPMYHAHDTVSPFDPINEDMMRRPALTPQEQGLKNAAPKTTKNILSKEEGALKDYQSGIERPY